MAKQSGCGDNFHLGGFDLSGDTASLGEIGGGIGQLDVTGIDKCAFERIGGIRDGRIEWVSHFNPAANQQHAVLSTLPTTDRILTYCRGTTLGSPAASLVAKQLNYDPTRDADGKMTIAVRAESNGFGIEWGKSLTAGKRTDTGVTNGTAVQFGYDGDDFLFLSGASGNYASTPDTATLDITGDLDLRARLSMDDWTPAAESTVIAKYTATGNQRSYALAITTGGNLIFRWSADGTAEQTATSSAATGFTDGTAHWVRATIDVDNGAANSDITFYTSADGVTWTQLGTVQNSGAVTSIFASTAVLEVGSQTAGTVNRMAGKFYRGEVLSGIGGTSVAAPVVSLSSAAITDATPLTWTVQGTAYLSTHTMQGLQGYLHAFGFTGTDATVRLEHSHDDGATDAYTTITGATFTALTTAPTAERIATGAIEIKRYVRAVTATTGGFTSLVFHVNAVVNPTATVF